MTGAISRSAPAGIRRWFSNATLFWLVVFVVTWLLSSNGRWLSKALDARWIIKYPSAWKINLKDTISASMKWLVEEASIGNLTFSEFTRGIAWLIEQPYDLALALISTGFVRGIGSEAVQLLPPMSWISVCVGVIALGHYAKNWFLAGLAGSCLIYLAVFGQWESAMVTLASIAIAVPIGVVGGLMLGLLAYRSPLFEKILSPVLDLMQTIPIFAYLVPILFMFGFGPVSALVATIIYAMPPMVRITTLALKNVDPELRDLGIMTGCTRRQLTWKVLVPTAIPSLMVGVNQVIMLSLNMVIIASMIGAGGLGYDVLTSLRRLDIGGGLEAGLAIVVLAIALDRLSQAFSVRKAIDRDRQAGEINTLPAWQRYRRTSLVILVIIVTMIGGYFISAIQTYPETLQMTTGEFWQRQVRYLNVNYFDSFEAVKTAILLNFMIPIKRFLLGIPWPWAVAVVIMVGWQFGQRRLALLTACLAGFIVVNGLWEKAMITLYLISASVVIASLIGLPMGLLAALSNRAGRVIGVFIDTLQTLPSFVYLIPVVMLFRVGDFTALIAIVLYALAPAVRYSAHGIKSVSSQLIEAGIVSGCTRWQLLSRIRLPLALPEILLGLNQTIMLALSMLVITALVGTRDLGQEVYIALTKADIGRGIVAGLAIAFIAIILDRIISASARNARIRYGLE
ncbi:MAG: ABC transporter permease subunit [Gammaproteobacteria bacterium]|nr:ABC transporter permease subunit [Gammaproteobacteria bacterium]